MQPPHPNSKKPHESLLSPVSSLSPSSTQMITEDSAVDYNYSIIGTVTVKLRVVAEWEQAALGAGKGVAQKTGDFSTSLRLHGGSPGGWRRWGAACWLLVGDTQHSGLCPRVLHREGTWKPVSPGFGERGRWGAAAEFSLVLW